MPAISDTIVSDTCTGKNELVRTDIVADMQSIEPGRPFRVAVRFSVADTWHINWINPGDAGLAPSVAWTLPEGFIAGITNNEIILGIKPVRPQAGNPSDVFFYPFDPGVIENTATQRILRDGAGYQLRILRSRMAKAIPTRLVGVLVSESGWGDGAPRAFLVDVPLVPR